MNNSKDAIVVSVKITPNLKALGTNKCSQICGDACYICNVVLVSIGNQGRVVVNACNFRFHPGVSLCSGYEACYVNVGERKYVFSQANSCCYEQITVHMLVDRLKLHVYELSPEKPM